MSWDLTPLSGFGYPSLNASYKVNQVGNLIRLVWLVSKSGLKLMHALSVII